MVMAQCRIPAPSSGIFAACAATKPPPSSGSPLKRALSTRPSWSPRCLTSKACRSSTRRPSFPIGNRRNSACGKRSANRRGSPISTRAARRRLSSAPSPSRNSSSPNPCMAQSLPMPSACRGSRSARRRRSTASNGATGPAAWVSNISRATCRFQPAPRRRKRARASGA
ncbi:hypothetical protein D3C78_1281110 [compost metagenome]